MIDFYNNFLKDYIGLIKDFVFVIGIFPVVIFVKNYLFNKKKDEIAHNLKIRKDIQEKLLKHADNYDRSKPCSIGIRLIYWKNYPYKLDNDGYNHILYYDVNMDEVCYPGANFLSNIGILIEDELITFNETVYKGKYGIYIIDKRGKKIKGFKEIKQEVKLVYTLKYKHIINWDFEEKIEYEPVFYTRYKFPNNKLYQDEFIVTNIYGERMDASKGEFLWEEFNLKNKVSSNISLKYFYLIIKYKLKNVFHQITNSFQKTH